VVVQDSKDSKVGKGTRVMLEPEPKETLGFKVTKVVVGSKVIRVGKAILVQEPKETKVGRGVQEPKEPRVILVRDPKVGRGVQEPKEPKETRVGKVPVVQEPKVIKGTLGFRETMEYKGTKEQEFKVFKVQTQALKGTKVQTQALKGTKVMMLLESKGTKVGKVVEEVVAEPQ
jgi:hypothetical protein